MPGGEVCQFARVVYNHVGPEGNHLADFGPYFTDRYRTPWGQAVNFDGEWSDEPHKRLREFYEELLRIHKRLPPLTNTDMSFIEATPFDNEKALLLRRWSDDEQLFACFNFGKNPAHVSLPLPPDVWKKVLNSRDHRWAVPGSSLPDCLPNAGNQSVRIEPFSFALYRSDDRGKT
jgi:1,4-alpha-glucan branching enzyme